MNIVSPAKRQALELLRRRVLGWLVRRGTPARKGEIARALGIDAGHAPRVLDHRWFVFRDGRLWLSLEGARELAGQGGAAEEGTDDA